DHDVGDGEARGRRRFAEVGRERGGVEGRAGHDDAVARGLRERAPGRRRRCDARERPPRHHRAEPGEGRDPGRRSRGRARRGGPRAGARQGGRRHRLRAGVGVNRRRLVALAILAALVGGRHVGAEEGGDRATMARLEQRAKTFYELLERGDRERATAAFPDLAGDLTSFSQSLQTRLDRMRDEVMERDGDLEELYRSPRWRDPEVMSLVATYHLAWVRYQGAQLTGDAQKKRALLQKAVEGFSQFLLVNE